MPIPRAPSLASGVVWRATGVTEPERAMINASVRHLDQARLLEARGQIEDAMREYRRASEFDPTNPSAALTHYASLFREAGGRA